MKKESQSLLDLINVLPIQAIISQSPIANKEAKVLYEIWKANSENDGDYAIPPYTDPTVVASLTSKGFIKNKISSNPFGRSVEFTGKAKNVIKNIILYTEKSVFEKSSEFNYDNIHRAIYDIPAKTSGKTASAKISSKPRNWLERFLWN